MLTSTVMIWLRINGDAPSVRRRRGVRAVCVGRGKDAARCLVPDAATLCNALEDASLLLRASERAFVRTKLWETARSVSDLRHKEGSRRRLLETAKRSLTEFEEEEEEEEEAFDDRERVARPQRPDRGSWFCDRFVS